MTKEVIKRYPIGTKIQSNFGGNSIGIQTVRNHNINSYSGKAYAIGSANQGGALDLMVDGIWASVIKEETLEELVSRFEKYYRTNRYSSGKALHYFFNENKETIHRLSK